MKRETRIERKAALVCILIAYTVFILCKTLLLRKPYEGNHLRLEPFWSYKVIDKQYRQMLCNVLLFIPFGVLLKAIGLKAKFVLLAGFAFSCSIELLQYLLKLGLCELDDVLHNTVGTGVGCAFGKVAETIRIELGNEL